jgi:cytochrome P450
MNTENLQPLPMTRTCPFDPPAEYKQLRKQPLYKIKTPRGDAAWLITRYEDARAVLTDERFSSDPRTPGFPSYINGNVPPPPGFFMQADDPDHKRLRSAVTKDFLVSHVNELRPKIQQIFDNVLDSMLLKGPPVNFVEVLAIPVASQVICELLGVPIEKYTLVKNLTDTVLDRTRSAQEAEAAAIKLMAYFDQIITEKEKIPTNDLLSRLVTEAAKNGQPSHEELVGIAALLLLGGYDTMALAMGLGLVVLLQHPDQLSQFLDGSAPSSAIVDELLRYVTINHAGLPRAATEDIEIGGQMILSGEGVLVMLNSANRDENIFENPDMFNINRKEQNHLGFGHGFHKCLGIHLAYAELEIAFRTLFQRLPSLRLLKDVDELSFRHEMVLYGLKELFISW